MKTGDSVVINNQTPPAAIIINNAAKRILAPGKDLLQKNIHIHAGSTSGAINMKEHTSI